MHASTGALWKCSVKKKTLSKLRKILQFSSSFFCKFSHIFNSLTFLTLLLLLILDFIFFQFFHFISFYTAWWLFSDMMALNALFRLISSFLICWLLRRLTDWLLFEFTYGSFNVTSWLFKVVFIRMALLKSILILALSCAILNLIPITSLPCKVDEQTREPTWKKILMWEDEKLENLDNDSNQKCIIIHAQFADKCSCSQ